MEIRIAKMENNIKSLGYTVITENTVPPRRERIAINRLRIGHTRLTHKFLITKEEPPQCPSCGVILTVEHLITECFEYEEETKIHNISSNIDEVLGPNIEDINKMGAMSFFNILSLHICRFRRSTVITENTVPPRRERIAINHLQIGHTRLTHKFLMTKEKPPQCPSCGVILTVEHLITECLEYEEETKIHNISSNIDEALGPQHRRYYKM
ncbi:RNase H domain-containing protein, partial [Aphis craccivora]